MDIVRNATCFVALTLALGGAAATAGLATAQGSPAPGVLSIDTPVDGDPVTNGAPVFIGGWAIGPAGSTAGVRVRAYLDGPAGRGTFLGQASYGSPRHDVAAAAGRPDWANSGFGLSWRPGALLAGDHVVHVEAESGGARIERTVTVRVTSNPTKRTNCSFILPCTIDRNASAWELDTGGPGITMDYIDDFPMR